MNRRLFVILFLLFSQVVCANNIVFQKITTKDGLANNSLNCILKDSNGYMWFGTDDGLSRYDGLSFQNFYFDYQSKAGLSSNIIAKMAESPDGNIWIGTSDRGLCVYYYQTGHIKQYPYANDEVGENGLIDLRVLSNDSIIFITSDQIVLFSKNNTPHYGVLNNSTFFPEGIELYSFNNVQGKLKIGTSYGDFDFSIMDNKPIISHGNIKQKLHKIIETERGLLASSGFLYYVLNDGSFQLVDNIPGKLYDVDEDHNIWFGNIMGLYVYQPIKDKNKSGYSKQSFVKGNNQRSLSSNYISVIYKDDMGIMWIGTKNGGINKYNPKAAKFIQYRRFPETSANNFSTVNTLIEDSNGKLWIGTSDRSDSPSSGVLFSDYLSASRVPHQVIDNVHYFFEFEYKGATYLIGGASYPFNHLITSINKGSNTYIKLWQPGLKEIRSNIFNVAKTESYLFFATYAGGLYRLNLDNGEIKKFTQANTPSLLSDIVRTLLVLNNGDILIGTSHGINVLSANSISNSEISLTQIICTKTNQLSHNYIVSSLQTSDSSIWIGTQGGGLNKFNWVTGKFNTWSTQEGLPNNVINALIEDDRKNLWITTNKGISRMSLADNKIETFDMDDGLEEIAFQHNSGCYTKDKQLLFGNLNGFTGFYPEELTSFKEPVKIHFTNLQVLNHNLQQGEKFGGRILLKKHINYSHEIKLKFRENSFLLNYSAINYTSPSKINYQYKLEGNDNEWSSPASDLFFVKYTGLAHGKYTFHLRAFYPSDHESIVEKKLDIIIHPPFYKTIGAYLIYCLFLIAVLYFIRGRIIIRNKLKQEKFEHEKVKELSQFKLRYFTNISHEFRTPLTLLLGYHEKIKEKIQHSKDRILKEDFDHANYSADLLLRLINQLLDFRKFEQGKLEFNSEVSDLILFSKEVLKNFNIAALNRNITLEFNSEIDHFYVPFDKEKLRKVYYNLLSNALKYSLEKSIVKVEVSSSNGTASIKFIDKGLGIPDDKKENIFELFFQAKKIRNTNIESSGIGLSFSKALVDMHGGTISFTSKEGQGTTFIVELPSGNQEPVLVQSQSPEEELSFQKTAPSANENRADAGKKTILVVEDNAELRQLIKKQLSPDYTIITAPDGEVGIKKCIAEHPDMVISDVVMPNKTGFELCDSIKNNQEICHIPVILLTAKVSEEDQVEGFMYGADAYVPKPFSYKVLKARIQAIINNRIKIHEKFSKSFDLNPSEVAITKVDETLLKRLISIIEKEITNVDFKVEAICNEIGFTQKSLNKKLKYLTGKTATGFIRSIRLKRAAQFLKETNYTIAEITYDVGFSDLQYFRKCFQEEFGVLPNHFRENKE